MLDPDERSQLVEKFARAEVLVAAHHRFKQLSGSVGSGAEYRQTKPAVLFVRADDFRQRRQRPRISEFAQRERQLKPNTCVRILGHSQSRVGDGGRFTQKGFRHPQCVFTHSGMGIVQRVQQQWVVQSRQGFQHPEGSNARHRIGIRHRHFTQLRNHRPVLPLKEKPMRRLAVPAAGAGQ